jgi:DNA-binding transcriptional ArsR family regulator
MQNYCGCMTDAADPTSTGPASTRLDERAVRVLAHPLRTRLLTELRRGGPATATELASTLGTNTGATSYHLRKLAEVGLVKETGDGVGRRRYWRAAHDMHSWSVADVADHPDALAAAHWLEGEQQRFYAELADRWAAQRQEWPLAWQDAAGASDYALRLTPDQVRQLREELVAVVERYRKVDEQPGSERVLFFMNAFPEPRGDQGRGR